VPKASSLLALPVAAGALYSIKTSGGHVRLDLVWASVAMALSSLSVVCSSLLLRTRLPVVGFKLGEQGLDNKLRVFIDYVISKVLVLFFITYLYFLKPSS
jgi:hypothetical protein